MHCSTRRTVTSGDAARPLTTHPALCGASPNQTGCSWVEQDPLAIWSTVKEAIAQALAQGMAAHGPLDVKAVGITNQRERFVFYFIWIVQHTLNVQRWQRCGCSRSFSQDPNTNGCRRDDGGMGSVHWRATG